MYQFVDVVKRVLSEESVCLLDLVVLILKTINVTRSSVHGPSNSTIQTQVVSRHPHKVAGSVSNFLDWRDNVNLLV